MFLSIYTLIYHGFLFQTPTVVSVGLPTELQTPATQFCLEQKFHGGANRHVWAVDFLQLLPVLPGANTHLVQFSINLGCGAYQPANRWSDQRNVITQKSSHTQPHVIQTCMTSVAHKKYILKNTWFQQQWTKKTLRYLSKHHLLCLQLYLGKSNDVNRIE